MIPKTAYEVLPYVYIGAGFTAALFLYNSYAIVSGILFLTVAAVIFRMRLKNRTDRMERFERLYTREKKKNE
ncbi:MAG: hypothetical protein USCGTAYLOR_02109 [Chromatiales bacterium USCg_Taylor]|nr:MAG: hypothetical protein USCGTAYLOR_02109 [Chromatiales bacterium USCg_Taylor]